MSIDTLAHDPAPPGIPEHADSPTIVRRRRLGRIVLPRAMRERTR
ncbi:hypothetical protein [Streptomyces sp. NRRL B-3229]|nr:hypothetical protein [Streptomyces sp. NRRL B-3229]